MPGPAQILTGKVDVAEDLKESIAALPRLAIGGRAVLFGAFVPLVRVAVARLLLVAIFTVHLPYPILAIKLIGVTGGATSSVPGADEVSLLYLACLAALVLGGSGADGVDNYLRKKSRRVAHVI